MPKSSGEQFTTLLFIQRLNKIQLYKVRQLPPTRVKRVQKLQNQLLKLLLVKQYRIPTDDLHLELKILKVKDITNQER